MENIVKHHLYSTFSAQNAYSELERLGKLYKDTNKRNLTVDLFFSDSGTKLKPEYGITVYFSKENEDELKFLIDNVNNR